MTAYCIMTLYSVVTAYVKGNLSCKTVLAKILSLPQSLTVWVIKSRGGYLFAYLF